MRRAVVTVGLLGACAEPTVDMNLTASTELTAISTTCVSAFAIQLDGLDYDLDSTDFIRDCYDIPEADRGATYADVQRAVSGRFITPLPMSGLAAVEVFGYRGTCQQNTRIGTDLVFYGSGKYAKGTDAVTVKLEPNLDCTRSNVVAKAIDIVKLGEGGCAVADFPPAKGIGLSTFAPMPFGPGVDWWGGADKKLVDGATGLATFDAATMVAPDSCLVASWTDTALKPQSTSCLTPTDQNVCLPTAQREVAAVNQTIWTRAIDNSKLMFYGGMILGIVYNGEPIEGATVVIDEDDRERGEVVYMQRAVDGDGAIVISPRQNQSTTDASGLFAIYTSSLIGITASNGAGTSTVRRTVGTAGRHPTGTYSAAMTIKI